MSYCEVRGNSIVCHRGQIPLPSCSVEGCLRSGTQLCDYVVAANPDPKLERTCSKAMCKFHAYSTLSKDLYPEHAPEDANVA